MAKLEDIHSIELDRTLPFDMRINLKDASGYTLESISVQQTKAEATFLMIYKKWCETF